MSTQPPRRPAPLQAQEPAQTAPDGAATPTPPQNPTTAPHGPTGAYLTPEQVSTLLRPIVASRVSQMDGVSHVEAWDIRAHLNRIFGFARWSEEVLDMTMIYEQQMASSNQNTPQAVRWRAAYRCTLRLTINAPDGTVLARYTETAAGGTMGSMPDSKREEAHDMAIKTAESQALKRCAANLGTQFGLSLYDKGNTNDVVRRVLVGGAPDPE